MGRRRELLDQMRQQTGEETVLSTSGRSTNDDRRVRVWEDGLTCIKFNLIPRLSLSSLLMGILCKVSSSSLGRLCRLTALHSSRRRRRRAIPCAHSLPFLQKPVSGASCLLCVCAVWAVSEECGNGINSFLLALRSIVFVGASVLLLSFQYQLLPEPEIRRQREIGVMRPTWIHTRSSKEQRERKKTSFLLTADHSFFPSQPLTAHT